MYGKLTIFVVCATVLQNSLAILSPTTSGSQVLAMLDLSMLRIYHKIAVLQLEKVSLSISAIERHGFLAKVCLEDCELLAEETLYTSRTCENELRIPLIAAADAVLAGVHIANSETSTAIVANARTISNNAQTELAEGVCSAIFLALGKNSTGVRSQIEIIADKQASGATTYIAGIFDAIRNGREDLNVKIELAINRAQNKANTDIVAAVNSVFKGIETLASYGTGTETESIISAIEMIRIRTFSGFEAVINTKFELLQSLFAASCIIEFGITIIPSFYGNATNSHLTTSENKNENEPVSGDCDSQTARQTAVLKTQIGVSAIFETVRKMAKFQLSKQNVREHDYNRKFVSSTNEDVAEDPVDDIERGRAETFGAYKIALKAIFCTIPTINPAANLEIQNAAISILRTSIDGVHMGMRTTQSNERNCTEILNQLKSIENTTTRNSIKLVSVIYAGIREGQKCDVETEAILDRAQKETISSVVKIYQAIYSSFRTLLAEREKCSETQAEGGDSSSSITADYNQASCEIYNYIRNVFDALDAVISTCNGQRAEIPNASCPATVY